MLVQLPSRDLHIHLDMSLPDLLTSGASFPSSSPFSPTCLLSSAFNSNYLIDRIWLTPQWQTPPLREWDEWRGKEREGGRDRAEAEGLRAGRTERGRLLPPLVAAAGSVIGAEKPKDKHRALRSKSCPKCVVVCHYWTEVGEDKRL